MSSNHDIQLQVSLGKSFSYLDYHTELCFRATKQMAETNLFSVIKKIVIQNDSSERHPDMVIRITFSSPIFKELTFHTGEIKENCLQEIMIPTIEIDGQKLYELNNLDVSSITVTLTNPDGLIYDTKTGAIRLYPINQPSADNELFFYQLAKYCVGDTSTMNSLHLDAVRLNNDQPLIGYQNQDRNSMIHEVECLYKAVHNKGVVYSNPPASEGGAFQKVRLPDTVIKDKLGTCLDLAILMCSLLLNVRYHPILLIIHGHAFCGCFLNEEDYFELVSHKPSEVFNNCVQNGGNILLFECTTLDSQCDTSFDGAVKAGCNHLRNYRGEFTALDICFLQKSFFLPIPVKDEEGHIDFEVKPIAMDETTYKVINDYEFHPVEEEIVPDRFSVWEQKLLDLTTTNRLVNFKAKSTSVVTIALPSGEEFFQYLKAASEGDSSFLLRSISALMTGNEGFEGNVLLQVIQEKKDQLLAKGIFVTTGDEKSIRKMIKASNSSQEETGSATLYLALGLITYDAKNYAPFILIPIRIIDKRLTKDFQVIYDLDNLMINQTFFEYYKLKNGVNYSSVYGVSKDNDYLDIVNTVRKIPGGDISIDENTVFISNFTFSHYVMWSDIRNRKADLLQNKVIESLLKNQSQLTKPTEETTRMDEKDRLIDFAAPLPYDSTQLEAILQCGKGNSFILDGPPGTGKSQTIVNMIINAFYHGKSVLFVAEKMAALDVVRKRLEKLGLDRFALELYSSDSNKKKVFDQLGTSMELGETATSPAFEITCNKVEWKKQALASAIQMLHDHKDGYLSLYEAITIDEEYSEYDGSFTLKDDYLTEYTEARDAEIKETIHDLTSLASGIESFDTNPIKTFLFQSFRITDQSAFFNQLRVTEESFNVWKDKHERLLASLCLMDRKNLPTILDLMDLLQLAFEGKVRSESLSYASAFQDKNTIYFELAALAEIEKTIKAYPELKIAEMVSYPVDSNSELLQRKGIPGFFAFQKVKKSLKPYLKDGNKPYKEKDKVSKLFADLAKYKKNHEFVYQDKERLNSFFGKDVLSQIENTEQLYSIFHDTERFFTLLMSHDYGMPTTEFCLRLQTILRLRPMDVLLSYQEARDSYALFRSHLNEIQSQYPFDQAYLEKEDLFSRYEAFFSSLHGSDTASELLSLALINQKMEILTKNGLSEFVDSLRHSTLSLEDLLPTFEEALAKLALKHYFKEDKVNYFSSESQEKTIQDYRNLIKEYNRYVVLDVANKISKNFVNSTIRYKEGSPIGALKKLVSKGGRGITIRNALLKYEDYFRTYFPCFLMSPLSAAQYLDVHSRKFDLVIFDEASQIPTSEAIGPIARGDALIVAGDPKQMPPTSFFQGDFVSDDAQDEALEDAESLLDDCLSIDLPRIRLSFHYRSRHESLITFSNEGFYDSKLLTFPSVDNKTSHIHFIQVTPTEEKKNNSLSEKEKDTILQIIKNLLLDPKTQDKSIGVILFNTKQQEAMQDAVDDLFDHNPALKAIDEKHEDPLFVKNLENVQGDERDIIILSIGFRKNASGKAAIVGPLTLEKGERRLNVACSRSKEQMYVVSTISASEIDASKSKNSGPKYLKRFLFLAEHASDGAFEQENIRPKEIARRIQDELKERGYDADLDVGASDFKIDLAIRKGDSPYLLGIMLDERQPDPYTTIRDRYYVETTMLGSLHWKMMNVYTLDYYRFRKTTIDKILKALEESPLPEVTKEDEPKVVFVPIRKEFDYKVTTYRKHKFKNTLNYDQMEKGYYYPILGENLNDLIEYEGPLSYNLIKVRARDLLGITQIKTKADGILQFHLNRIHLYTTTDHNGTKFYWPSSNPEHVITSFRNSDRDIEDIPKEEIILLFNRIIEAQQSVNREDLYRIFLEMNSGTTLLNSHVKNKLDYVLDYAISHKLLKDGFVEHYE